LKDQGKKRRGGIKTSGKATGGGNEIFWNTRKRQNILFRQRAREKRGGGQNQSNCGIKNDGLHSKRKIWGNKLQKGVGKKKREKKHHENLNQQMAEWWEVGVWEMDFTQTSYGAWEKEHGGWEHCPVPNDWGGDGGWGPKIRGRGIRGGLGKGVVPGRGGSPTKKTKRMLGTTKRVNQ